MKVSSYVILLAGSILFGASIQNMEPELVWSEEFSYEGLPDSDKWSYNVGGHGWGNNELQYYTEKRSDNARVEDGKLIITANKESFKNKEYTSARLITKNKGDWKYGKIEVRAKLPDGLGTWPAIWMLPTLDRGLDWPKDGEIDIMEHVGYNLGTVYGTIHTKKYNHMIGTQKSDSVYIEDLHENFHVYSIDWDEKQITWSVDNEEYLTLFKENEDELGWPFDKEFHLILNLAVGGNWGGKMGVDEDIWPKQLEVDYVRVYQ
ncbi:MAG: glycoside hydrolase family 16 protein [bacterium]|nr:glycoside hydrolase family 16 protein [bacterium]